MAAPDNKANASASEVVIRKLLLQVRIRTAEPKLWAGHDCCRGDAGITIDRNLDIAVTTGNSYTGYGTGNGKGSRTDIDLSRAEVAILGATGSIGVVPHFARKVNYLTPIACTQRLERLAERINGETGLAVKVTPTSRKRCEG